MFTLKQYWTYLSNRKGFLTLLMFHTQWASWQAFVPSFSCCHSGWWLRLHLQSEFRALWQREVVEKLQRASAGWPKWSGLIGTARDLMVWCGLNCSLQLPNEL